MLEVVFNESASICMLMAQNYGKGSFPREYGIPGFAFCGEEVSSEEELEKMRADCLAEEQERWTKAVPLVGKKSDIFCFDFILNIGGIAECFLEERKRVFSRFNYAEVEEAEYRMQSALERLEVFCRKVCDGEAVRIWFGNQPEEQCGVLWLCHEIVRRELPIDKINFVKLPNEKLNAMEIDEEEWSQLAVLQTLIEPEEIKFYASQWEALREANAPLRVVTDGCVLSATDDFYDEAIWQEIEKQEGDFYQTKLIGRLLDQRIGIRDSWISYRFDCFLDAGRLELVAVDHECPWIRILRKRG